MKDSTYLAIVRLIYRPLYRSAFHATVRGRLVDPNQPRGKRFLKPQVDALLADTWREVGRILTADQLGQYRTRRGQSNVFFAALMVASYRVLRASGLSREYATELCGDAGWKVYTTFAVMPKALARVRAPRSAEASQLHPADLRPVRVHARRSTRPRPSGL